MSERNIRLIVEYEGTSYAGWQVQDAQPTVQSALVEAIKRVTGCEVNLIGAGRTDAGVHALGQVANFHVDHRLEPERYRDAINYYLPDDIRVRNSDQAEDSFHARFDARFRRYRYLVSADRSAVYRNLRCHYPYEVDHSLLQQAAGLVRGEHDFAPFCVVTSRKEDNTCRIDSSRWYRWGPLLVYEIRGNRFLHSMVRSLVGSMLNLATVTPDANRLNLTLDSFTDIITASTGQRVAFTAPAHGLYLVSVGY
jgi:tRNA pseudouridine38-40 synthase